LNVEEIRRAHLHVAGYQSASVAPKRGSVARKARTRKDRLDQVAGAPVLIAERRQLTVI